MNIIRVKMAFVVIASILLSGLISHFVVWHLAGYISRSEIVYNDERLALVEIGAMVMVLIASAFGGMAGYLIVKKLLR